MFSKNKRDTRRSLFGRLFLGFLSVMLGIWFCILMWDMYEARTYRDDTLQDTKGLARQILILMPLVSGKSEEVGHVVRQMEKAREAGFKERGWYVPQLRIQIWKDGSKIYSSGPALFATSPAASLADESTEENQVKWVERDPKSGVTVSVAQEVTGRWIFTTASIGYYLLPLLYSLPFLLIPAWFIIKAGLRPLESIVGEIEQRSSADPPSPTAPGKALSPLAPLLPSPYKELSPLVASVNRLMKRLAERFEREQEFLLNAAHEMKIPLAIIQLNSEAMINHSDRTALIEARDGLQQGVSRATHTVHQLLALARSGVDLEHAEAQPMDLIELVQDCLALAAQMAMPRGVEIELQSPEKCVLPLHRETAALLVDNLIGNAVKYSPDKGRISVCIASNARGTQLTIVDEGPGIPPGMRKKVFERFFRLPVQEQTGSGLGLAIAESAALRNNASIRFDAGPGGKGLAAIVEFGNELRIKK